MIRLLNVQPDDNVIDIGCGEGYLLSLLPKAKRVTGFDMSKTALSNARRRLQHRPAIEFLMGDGQKLPFSDNIFNKVVCSEMLEHVPEPRQVLQEIRRISTENSRVVISVPDEKRIKNIMRLIQALGLKKILFSARKKEDYEWHLHDSSFDFITGSIKDLFVLSKVTRVPFLYGYRFVIELIPHTRTTHT